MELNPIKSEKDYRNTLERLELIFDAPIDTKEDDEAEILSLLIEITKTNMILLKHQTQWRR